MRLLPAPRGLLCEQGQHMRVETVDQRMLAPSLR
jgi:hypothetical protein